MEEVLFVYGTLMRGQPNHRELKNARFLRPAWTKPQFQLVDFGPYPALVTAGRHRVRGELYAIDPVRLPDLDDFEGAPYERCRIELSGGASAWVYVVQPAHGVGRPVIVTGDWKRKAA